MTRAIATSTTPKPGTIQYGTTTLSTAATPASRTDAAPTRYTPRTTTKAPATAMKGAVFASQWASLTTGVSTRRPVGVVDWPASISASTTRALPTAIAMPAPNHVARPTSTNSDRRAAGV